MEEALELIATERLPGGTLERSVECPAAVLEEDAGVTCLSERSEDLKAELDDI